MTDLPILFSAPMIRALLAGRKTQTRRVLKLGTMLDPMPNVWEAKEIDGVWHFVSDHPDCGGRQKAPVRFRKGDRLWVREAFCNEPVQWHPGPTSLVHRAGFPETADTKSIMARHGVRWKLGIHMPRWASRLTLTVTDVRVQRLNECSEADALAEGVVQARDSCFIVPGVDHPNKDFGELSRVTAREMYGALWDVINGSGQWITNPWVVALTFTVERRNIDA